MRNFTTMGYETITVIRSEYPPELGKCLDISPTLWIQTIENTDNVGKQEKKFFVFARNNCIKEIYEISSAISDFVDGIITPCGTIIPMDNKIEFLDSEGIGLECVDGKIKFVIKAPLDTTLGGTGFIEFNEGDILVGNAEGKLSILIKGDIGQAIGIKPDGTVGYIDVVKKLTCDGSDTVTENAFVRWNADGKCLKDSKTIQDQNGNTSTRTSADTLSYITSNESEDENSTAVHTVESKGGRPINRLFIPDKQLVDSYISNTDYSYNVFLNDIENAGLAATCLRINRKGNVSHPFQYRAIAILESDTANVTGDGTFYQHGSAKALNVLKDQGNQFFGGNGTGSPATYTVLEDNTYLCYMHITFNSTGDKPAELVNRIITSSGRTYVGRGFIAGGIGNSSVTLLVGIDAVAGEVFTFVTAAFANPKAKVISFSGTAFPTITTYIGIYCLG